MRVLECLRAINTVGLEPSIGFLHEIAQSKEIDNLYDVLPKSKRDAITERDKKLK